MTVLRMTAVVLLVSVCYHALGAYEIALPKDGADDSVCGLSNVVMHLRSKVLGGGRDNAHALNGELCEYLKKALRPDGFPLQVQIQKDDDLLRVRAFRHVGEEWRKGGKKPGNVQLKAGDVLQSLNILWHVKLNEDLAARALRMDLFLSLYGKVDRDSKKWLIRKMIGGMLRDDELAVLKEELLKDDALMECGEDVIYMLAQQARGGPNDGFHDVVFKKLLKKVTNSPKELDEADVIKLFKMQFSDAGNAAILKALVTELLDGVDIQPQMKGVAAVLYYVYKVNSHGFKGCLKMEDEDRVVSGLAKCPNDVLPYFVGLLTYGNNAEKLQQGVVGSKEGLIKGLISGEIAQLSRKKEVPMVLPLSCFSGTYKLNEKEVGGLEVIASGKGDDQPGHMGKIIAYDLLYNDGNGKKQLSEGGVESKYSGDIYPSTGYAHCLYFHQKPIVEHKPIKGVVIKRIVPDLRRMFRDPSTQYAKENAASCFNIQAVNGVEDKHVAVFNKRMANYLYHYGHDRLAGEHDYGYLVTYLADEKTGSFDDVYRLALSGHSFNDKEKKALATAAIRALKSPDGERWKGRIGPSFAALVSLRQIDAIDGFVKQWNDDGVAVDSDLMRLIDYLLDKKIDGMCDLTAILRIKHADDAVRICKLILLSDAEKQLALWHTLMMSSFKGEVMLSSKRREGEDVRGPFLALITRLREVAGSED